MAAQHPAVLETKHAALSSEFGLDWATKLFGSATIDSLPRVTRGSNKGQPKGFVHWRKATTGGWSTDLNCVVLPGIIDAWIAPRSTSYRHEAMTGDWLGRQQLLSGSRHYLFDEGRRRHAAEEVRRHDEYEAKVKEREQGRLAVDRYWWLLRLAVRDVFQGSESVVDDYQARIGIIPDYDEMFYHGSPLYDAADLCGRQYDTITDADMARFDEIEASLPNEPSVRDREGAQTKVLPKDNA